MTGFFFLTYRYILAFSDMILSKLVESENVFQKMSGKISKIFIFPSILGHYRYFNGSTWDPRGELTNLRHISPIFCHYQGVTSCGFRK